MAWRSPVANFISRRKTNKVIGRYDPATQSVDWVLGHRSDRTHMVVVSENLDRIVTSNVSSGTISLIELVSPPTVGFGTPPGNPPGNTFVAGFTPATADTPRGGPPLGLGSPPASARKTWRVTSVPAGRGAEGFDVSPDGKEIWAANGAGSHSDHHRCGEQEGDGDYFLSRCRCHRLKFSPDGKRVLISGLAGSATSNLVGAGRGYPQRGQEV